MMAGHHMTEEEITSLLRETEAISEDATAYRAFCRNRQAILEQLVRLENDPFSGLPPVPARLLDGVDVVSRHELGR